MTKVFVSIIFLLTISAFAGNKIAYNCPIHGPRSDGEVEHSGTGVVCQACLEEKKAKDQEREKIARTTRITGGKIYESDLPYIKDRRIRINTRSFGSTNNFERMCFRSVVASYFKVNGEVTKRSDYPERMFEVVQSLGGGDYLAKLGDDWCKICTGYTGLVDDRVYKFRGCFVNELFSYQTVLGANRRIRVFKTIDVLGISIEELSFSDILDHLNKGKEFDIRFTFNDGRSFLATISTTGGFIIIFGK